jgi:ABC-type protease/lipase transport system fused ATPase/permease subunit
VSWYTVAWFGWGAYFLIVEGMALASSTRGRTFSEHVWSFLGLGLRRGATHDRPVNGWTKVRRIAVGLFMFALGAHFLIGSNTLGNGVLIATSVLLAAVVLGTGVVRHFRRPRAAPPQTGEESRT